MNFVASNQSMHIKTYNPPSEFVTTGIPSSASTISSIEFLAQVSNTPPSELREGTRLQDSVFTHIPFDHVINGQKVINHHAKISMAKSEIISYSYNFAGSFTIKPQEEVKTNSEIKSFAASTFQASVDPGHSEKVLVDVGGGKLVQALSMQLLKEGSPAYSVAVDDSLAIVYYVNYVAN